MLNIINVIIVAILIDYNLTIIVMMLLLNIYLIYIILNFMKNSLENIAY
jgi:Ca2+/Na+ antiporter